MNRPKVIALFALTMCAAGLLWVLWLRQHEPVYQGKPLSEWVISELLARAGTLQKERVDDAISRIGTDGLPFLIKWLPYTEPEGGLQLFGMRVPSPTRDRRAELGQGSFIALRILGPRAAPVLPDLIYLLKGTNTVVAFRALGSIEAIGMEGVPALLDYVTNRQAYSFRSTPISAMRNLGTNGASVVPVLVQCLQSPDTETARTAVILLGNIGPGLGIGTQARFVVDTLVVVTESTNALLRLYAVHALTRLASESAVPTLVRALCDSDARVRFAATNSLRKVAPQVLGEKPGEHDL